MRIRRCPRARSRRPRAASSDRRRPGSACRSPQHEQADARVGRERADCLDQGIDHRAVVGVVDLGPVERERSDAPLIHRSAGRSRPWRVISSTEDDGQLPLLPPVPTLVAVVAARDGERRPRRAAMLESPGTDSSREWVDADGRDGGVRRCVAAGTRDLRRDHGREGHRFRPQFLEDPGFASAASGRGLAQSVPGDAARASGWPDQGDDRARGERHERLHLPSAPIPQPRASSAWTTRCWASSWRWSARSIRPTGSPTAIRSRSTPSSWRPPGTAGHRSGQRQRGVAQEPCRRSQDAAPAADARDATPLIGRGENRAPRSRPHRQRYGKGRTSCNGRHGTLVVGVSETYRKLRTGMAPSGLSYCAN